MKYEINYDDKWIRYTWWKIEIDEYRWLGSRYDGMDWKFNE